MILTHILHVAEFLHFDDLITVGKTCKDASYLNPKYVIHHVNSMVPPLYGSLESITDLTSKAIGQIFDVDTPRCLHNHFCPIRVRHKWTCSASHFVLTWALYTRKFDIIYHYMHSYEDIKVKCGVANCALTMMVSLRPWERLMHVLRGMMNMMPSPLLDRIFVHVSICKSTDLSCEYMREVAVKGVSLAIREQGFTTFYLPRTGSILNPDELIDSISGFKLDHMNRHKCLRSYNLDERTLVYAMYIDVFCNTHNGLMLKSPMLKVISRHAKWILDHGIRFQDHILHKMMEYVNEFPVYASGIELILEAHRQYILKPPPKSRCHIQ
jgi:hypothetical protein